VIERSFAEALGVRVGDKLTLNDRRFTVAGIAVTAAQSPYPNLCADGAGGCGVTMRYLSQAFGVGPRKVGLMWTTESDAIGLASKFNPLDIYVVNLKLADAAAANTLMNRFPGPSGASPFEGPLFVTS